jgi:hypothetical protein
LSREFKDVDRQKLKVIRAVHQFPKTDIEFLSEYGYLMTKEMYSKLWIYIGSDLLLVRYKTEDPFNSNQYIIW